MPPLELPARARTATSRTATAFATIRHRAVAARWFTFVIVLGLSLLAEPPAHAGGLTVTFVGVQVSIPTSQPSTPVSVAVDSNGIVYIADSASHQILKETP